MMINKTIGQIILRGGTSEDIRKEIPDFPLNPTKDYFCKLGYKESTAKNYEYRLKHNSKKIVSDNSNNISIQNSDTLADDVNSLESMFFTSKSPDYNNLLVDTCALAYEETLEIIEQAQHVTFIYATIEEMDRKKKLKKGEDQQKKRLASNIALYINKMLKEKEKYMLSSFSGMKGERYPDNILLQYMKILPAQIRPTLITADKNLAVKAKMLDLQYILFDVAEFYKKFHLGYGVYQITIGNQIYIDYNGKQRISVIHEDGCETLYEGKRLKIKSGERICIYLKHGDKVVEKYINLKI